MKRSTPLLTSVVVALALLTLPASLLAASNTANNALESIRDWRGSMPSAAGNGPNTIVQLKNSRLSLSENTRFQVEELHGVLQPASGNGPFSLDNFAEFEVVLNHARVRISDAVLQSLVQAELQASQSPLRIGRVNTTPQSIQIEGDIRRLGLWIPFSMEGTPTVNNAREITLTPSRLKVAGLPVYKALLATNIQLQSLLNMKSKAVALQGQAMVLRLDQVLQAPKVQFELNSLKLEDGEVTIQFGKTPQAPPYFCNTLCPNNFAYTEGGELRAAGMVLSGQPALVTGVSNGLLPLALHDLNQLITTSTIQLRTDGAIWISAQEGVLDEKESALLSTGEKTIAQLEALLDRQAAQLVKHLIEQQAVTLAVHHATLLTKEGIELRVEKLLASTNSTDLGKLPTAPQTVHVGEILLSENALNTLMNKALFNYDGSPIRKVKSTIGDPLLKLTLQVKPEVLGIPLFWLPATLSGELLISNDQNNLEFTPSGVHLFGLPVLPLIQSMGMTLESLIKIDRPAVKLQGNTIRIALNDALPPLQLNTKLQTIKPVLRSPWGPFIHVHVGTQTPEKIGEIYSIMEFLPLGLWMNTPEFTALGMRTGPTLGHVYNAPRSERLEIDLAKYPDLLSSATMRLPKQERVWVSMPGRQAAALQNPVEGHRHENQAHQVPHHHK